MYIQGWFLFFLWELRVATTSKGNQTREKKRLREQDSYFHEREQMKLSATDRTQLQIVTYGINTS